MTDLNRLRKLSGLSEAIGSKSDTKLIVETKISTEQNMNEGYDMLRSLNKNVGKTFEGDAETLKRAKAILAQRGINDKMFESLLMEPDSVASMDDGVVHTDELDLLEPGDHGFGLLDELDDEIDLGPVSYDDSGYDDFDVDFDIDPVDPTDATDEQGALQHAADHNEFEDAPISIEKDAAASPETGRAALKKYAKMVLRQHGINPNIFSVNESIVGDDEEEDHYYEDGETPDDHPDEDESIFGF